MCVLFYVGYIHASAHLRMCTADLPVFHAQSDRTRVRGPKVFARRDVCIRVCMCVLVFVN